MYICKWCNKECKNTNSLRQHEIRCKENPNHITVKPTYGYKGKVGWSRGLNKETDERVKNISKGVNKYLETHPGTFLGKKHSDKTKQIMSKNARENNFQSHWGFRKSYPYNCLTLQSSYEVETAKSLDANNVIWNKPKYGLFEYIDNLGKVHTYTPDFYLPEYDVYLDPKNDFLINNINPALGYSDKEKIEWVSKQNNVKIIILDKNQLTWDVIKKLL